MPGYAGVDSLIGDGIAPRHVAGQTVNPEPSQSPAGRALLAIVHEEASAPHGEAAELLARVSAGRLLSLRVFFEVSHAFSAVIEHRAVKRLSTSSYAVVVMPQMTADLSVERLAETIAELCEHGEELKRRKEEIEKGAVTAVSEADIFDG
ncbi:MAG: hypothetical protein R6W94_08455 [Spirochaetia bacterium]